MINLKKLDKPQVLVDHAKEWTDEYLGYIARGEAIPANVKYRYRHKDIKNKLIKETHGKCAYCESDVLHVSPGDVEHILPKNKDAHPELYVEWTILHLRARSAIGVIRKITMKIPNLYSIRIRMMWIVSWLALDL